MALHFRLFQQTFECLEKLHHARIRFKISKVVVNPEENDSRHFITYSWIVKTADKKSKQLIQFYDDYKKKVFNMHTIQAAGCTQSTDYR